MKIYLLALILSVLLLSPVMCDGEAKEKDPSQEKSKHYVFRTDPNGFEVMSDKFTHIFINFYSTNDLEKEVEEHLDTFAKENFGTNMIFLAIEQQQSEKLMKQMNVEPKFENEFVLLRNGVAFSFAKDIKQNYQEFTQWGIQQLVSEIKLLENEEDLKTLLHTYEENSVIFYKGQNDESGFDLIKTYVQSDVFAQNYIKNVYYYEIPEANKNSTLVALKTTPYEEEKVFVHDENLKDKEGLIDFLRVATLKAVTTLNEESYLSIFGTPINSQVMFFEGSNQEKNKEALEIFEKAALYNVNEQMSYQRGIFTIVENNEERQSLYKLFKLTGIEEPQIVVTKTDRNSFSLDKHRYSAVYKELSQDNIVQFLEDVQLKKIDPYYQSEDVPTYSDEVSIRTVVGDNFKDEVLRQKISYLVLFWDSKDKFSSVQYEKLLNELIDKYGDKFKNLLKIGKFNLNLNENEMVRLDRAPQLVIYPQQDKKNPMAFSASIHNLENLKQFLKQWVQNIDLEDPLPLGGPEEHEKIDL